MGGGQMPEPIRCQGRRLAWVGELVSASTFSACSGAKRGRNREALFSSLYPSPSGQATFDFNQHVVLSSLQLR